MPRQPLTPPIRRLLSCLMLTSSAPAHRSVLGTDCDQYSALGEGGSAAASAGPALRQMSFCANSVNVDWWWVSARRQPATRCNRAPQDQTNCEKIGDAALADGFHETYDDFARYSRLIRIVRLCLSTEYDRRSRHHLSAGTSLASTTLRPTTTGGCTSSPPCGCGSSANPSGSSGATRPLHRPGFEQAALPARLCSAHLPRLQPRPICEAGPGPVRAASTPRHLAASDG